jgi:mono/diheme cytochrome c family protein
MRPDMNLCTAIEGKAEVASKLALAIVTLAGILWVAAPAQAQETDVTQAPNAANAGAKKSYAEQIGAGRGDIMTPDSSAFIIARDPFRSIRRGRNLFQRKFTVEQGLGPRTLDGVGDIETDGSIGAGLADSCAACHGRPRGSAGSGGDVFTRPDSRDAPHLFGLGLKEMLADEITRDLRQVRSDALLQAGRTHAPVRVRLESKGIRFGFVTAFPSGGVDTNEVEGVDPDLRVRPFFHHGGTISIREFIVGALNAEMGLEAVDPGLLAASRGGAIVTPAGMVLDGSLDRVESPVALDATDDPDADGIRNEVPEAVVDHLEFYLLNYFKPASYRQTPTTRQGRDAFGQAGCTSCHMPDLVIEHDRRVADVQTAYDAVNGRFNNLFATATALFAEVDDSSGNPTLKRPQGGRFVVRNIFTDFKRHDLGPAFHERNFATTGSNFADTERRQFLTTALWGVGTTGPYGHDGRSINLREVVLRHGGEAAQARGRFAALPQQQQSAILEFLESLVLFPPDDTASNLNPGNSSTPGFPQFGHGSIFLPALFNQPGIAE